MIWSFCIDTFKGQFLPMSLDSFNTQQKTGEMKSGKTPLCFPLAAYYISQHFPVLVIIIL